MNATAEAVPSAVGARTLEILERRRSSSFKRRGRLVRAALLIADLVGLTLAFVITELTIGDVGPNDTVSISTEALLFVASLPLWAIVAKLYRLYDHDDERTDHTTLEDLVGVFHLVTVGTWLVVGGGWLLGLADPKIGKLLTFWILAIALVTGFRGVARAVCRRQLAFLQNTVIVGAGDIGQLVARKFLQHEEYGINVVGFVDANPRELRSDLGDLPVLGPVDAAAGARRPPGRRAGRGRILQRPAGPNGRDRPLGARPRCPGGDRPSALRARRPARQGAHGREPAAGRPSDRQALPVLADAQADRRCRRSLADARPHRPLLRLRGLADPARVAGTGLLPPDAPRQGHAPLHGSQVPDDARGHRRLGPPRVHQADDVVRRRRRPRTASTSSSATTRSRRSAASSAGRAWTSCRT